ncbi:Integral membrane protein [Mycena chlorophos]|uniref:Integral membrane protein n=1 Tax=Mycena chlorophos TaxID=658473 RepID=A0A8H6W1Q9_MYCCL|nr:Integral membrane protein [Mycena chlorophos]
MPRRTKSQNLPVDPNALSKEGVATLQRYLDHGQSLPAVSTSTSYREIWRHTRRFQAHRRSTISNLAVRIRAFSRLSKKETFCPKLHRLTVDDPERTSFLKHAYEIFKSLREGCLRVQQVCEEFEKECEGDMAVLNVEVERVKGAPGNAKERRELLLELTRALPVARQMKDAFKQYSTELAMMQQELKLFEDGTKSDFRQILTSAVQGTRFTSYIPDIEMPVSSNTYAATPLPTPTPSPIVIRASGPPADPILDCPESTVVDYALRWYRLPGAPDFLICSACHAKHIAQSPLARAFESVHRPDGAPSKCRFWVPRVVDILWPHAVQRNDLNALLAFAQARPQVMDCVGTGGAPGSAGVHWFAPNDNDLDDFVACRACMEDHLVGTTFESRFGAPALMQRADEVWACDMSFPYITRAAKEFGIARGGDWTSFKAAVVHRMRLAACTGGAVDPRTRTWFTTRRRIDDMVFCETCFLDTVALTEFENEFVPLPPAQEEGLQWMCDLAMPTMQVPFSAALTEHNFAIFWDAANRIIHAPFCGPEGITGGRWFTLNGGCDGFAVCERCFAGWIVPLRAAPHFCAIPSPGNTRLCSFHPTAPRFQLFFTKLAQSFVVGLITPFAEAVRTLAHIVPCRGATQLVNASWYGFPDAPICPDCYATFAANTPLGKSGQLPLTGQPDPRPTLCTLYSQRMRSLWLNSASDPQQFINAARTREAVFKRVQPLIDALERQRVVKRQQALHQGALALRYKGMAGLRELSGTTDGHLYRAPSGYQTTWEGAKAERLMANMSAGLADSTRGEEIVRISQLKTEWAMVE